jgi:hypothetical protein
MPIHAWTKVETGTFHHFHQAWINELSFFLNDGHLPENCYAMAEQVAGDIGPDVLPLKSPADLTETALEGPGRSLLKETPPLVRFIAHSDAQQYVKKQNSVVIRHASGDRILAILEVISGGNKASKKAFRQLLNKIAAALEQGIHLLLVDLYPPTSRDPQGIHGAVWSELFADDYQISENKPLTAAGYRTGGVVSAFVEPLAVGDMLPEMPLFIDSSRYVPVGLEATYQLAWQRLPLRWQKVLEAS